RGTSAKATAHAPRSASWKTRSCATRKVARSRSASRPLASLELGPHARRDAVLANPPRVDLEHVPGRARNAARAIVQYRDLFLDAEHGAIQGEEEHVERDAGVAHPERAHALIGPREEHARALRQLRPVHEPARVLRCG